MKLSEAIYQELVTTCDNYNDNSITWTQGEKDAMSRHIAFLKWLEDNTHGTAAAALDVGPFIFYSYTVAICPGENNSIQ